MKANKQKKISGAAFTAPILIFSVMLLIAAGKVYVERASKNGENLYLSLSIVQIIAFFIPALLYYQLKHRRFSTRILISPVRMSHGIFILFTSLMFFSGQLLLKYFLYKHFGVSSTPVSIDSVSGAVPTIQLLLAFCIVPAICEEFFFRGVILSEYRSYGVAEAVILSSITFAFVHFSFENFIIYLYAGLMLGFVTVVCRSIIPAIVLHLANNVMDLYLGSFFARLTENESDTYLVKFLIILIFLISIWRVFSHMQHVYTSYAQKPPKEPLALGKNKQYGAFRSATLLLPLIAFLLISAILSWKGV